METCIYCELEIGLGEGYAQTDEGKLHHDSKYSCYYDWSAEKLNVTFGKMPEWMEESA